MKKLLAIVLALVMVFSFAACGGGEETAKKAVEKGLTTIKNFDQEGIEKYFADAAITEEALAATGVEEAKAIFSTFSWKITSCEEEGERAVAQVDLTCVSLQSIMTDLISEMMTKMLDGSLTEADVETYTLQRMGEMIKEKDRETVTQSIEFILEKVDGQWKITNPEVIVSVISSGLEGLLGGTDEK